MLLRIAVVCIGVLIVSPRAARADAPPLGSGCYVCALWMPAGINIGAGPRWQGGDAKATLLLGGEVSLIDMRPSPDHHDWAFFGGYVDGLYDMRAQHVRISLGPEVVMLHPKHFGVGLDAGVVAEFADDKPSWGGRIRAFAPIPFLTPYLGLTRIATGTQATILEAGVLAKFPFVLAN